MKLKAEQITSGEEEIIIRYKTMTPRIRKLLQYLEQEHSAILGKKSGRQYRLEPGDIYYFESIEERLFAYTREGEYQVMMTLSETEQKFAEDGFFRCSKSMTVNINKIAFVKSGMGNRIDAALDNGEHVIISRHYAKKFRAILKGGEVDA